jgi:hypothetical protein
MSPGIEQQIDRAFADPQMAKVYGPMARDFPDEFTELRSELIERAQSGASEADLAAVGFRRMRTFTLSHTKDAVASPDDALIGLAKAQLEVAKALRKTDVDQCADFGMRGLQPGKSLAPEAEAAVLEGTRAMLHAIREGIDYPQQRSLEVLSPADGRALLAGIKQRVSPEVYAAITSPRGMTGLSSRDQCDGTVAIYEATLSLPARRAATVTAFLTMQARSIMEG